MDMSAKGDTFVTLPSLSYLVHARLTKIIKLPDLEETINMILLKVWCISCVLDPDTNACGS